MFTTETALESLKKFDISETTLSEWENELGLMVPVDEYGRKQYSPHHINLFKNIKKHIALGRSIDQIKHLISLPPTAQSKPHAHISPPNAQHSKQSQLSTGDSMPTPNKPYASNPQRPPVAKSLHGRDAGLVELVNKLMVEKDQLHKKLMETEKLNSHLYNANTMFHRKVKELSQQITSLKGFITQIQEKIKANAKDDQSLRLMDEKSRLQKQLLELEKSNLAKEQEVETKSRDLILAVDKVQHLEDQLKNVMVNFDPANFIGDWVEKGQLLEIVYDNFGINIEPERHRMFRISEKPLRCFGHSAIITTYYEYETNSLWKRTENLMVSYLDENRLEGEILVDYILDGVPVAQASYRVHYTRRA
ncbi:MAG: MerR family transcriptional regulator [Cyanobacteria bacterium]|nr:MerR family transcriptional regulator [Cyanobacteriota bacterium]